MVNSLRVLFYGLVFSSASIYFRRLLQSKKHGDDLETRRKDLIKKTGTLVRNAVTELLSNLRYPLEEAIDLRKQESQIENLGVLLKCFDSVMRNAGVEKLEGFVDYK